MSEVAIDTLLKLLDRYKVEIPILQRDYAQGRQTDHAKMVRKNLLRDMRLSVLEENPPLDLNFVYGKAEGDKFIPLDGQQRLTTLFLLCLYAYYDDETKTQLFEKFSYETRKSSRDFLEKLVEKRSLVFTSNLSPSEEIKDSEWFVSIWKYDPTIQSVLVMLDDIEKVFGDIKDLPQRLSGATYNPIVFIFLEMQELGMEDSLYIKLNARGRPITSFENFKARLIGRLKMLNLKFENEFERLFDQEWTDLFWSNYQEEFDITFLSFFAILLMNQGILDNDNNWSNQLDFNKIGKEIFETIFYTLNYLVDHKDNEIVHELIFNAVGERRSYQDRLLFHIVTTYLYLSKGSGGEPFDQWIRILRNLIRNSQIDELKLYHNAIEEINSLASERDNLLNYFAQKGNVSVFSIDQRREEQLKAKLILENDEYSNVIYAAEAHPYFSGQIRSALHLSMKDDSEFNKDLFIKYWEKISELFDETSSKYGHLLRQALLTLGDYRLSIGNYKTLCIDDPNEASSTPSLKRLFSNNGNIVKKLLDLINLNGDIKIQLENIIKNSTVPKNDWRHCFITYPSLFRWMSMSHLRLRSAHGEIILIPNLSSNGYNYEIFSAALYTILWDKGIETSYKGDFGAWGDRYLVVKEFLIRFKKGSFIVADHSNEEIFKTKSDDPINEAVKYITNEL